MIRPRKIDWSLCAFALIVVYAAYLCAMQAGHLWLTNAQGQIVANDFIAVWTAGCMALSGHAAQAYNWPVHHAAEIAVAGHRFYGYYGWHYPPQFLFVALALAGAPYFVAFALLLAATLPAYLLAVAGAAGDRRAWLFALAFPAVLMDVWVGQNGFLSAALIGGTLVWLDERPLLSGICLALLTYKPQFGLLFPFVLLAGGYWRTCLAAALAAGLLMAASWLAFGPSTWIAFIHSVPVTTHLILDSGHAGWNKLQSLYGLARLLGGTNALAWTAQLTAIGACGIALIALWRTDSPFALKAAALATATLFATPYLYIYDFPILAVAIAFLWRQEPFDVRERWLIALACAGIVIFPWAGAPTGLLSTMSVATIIGLRALPMLRGSAGNVLIGVSRGRHESAAG